MRYLNNKHIFLFYSEAEKYRTKVPAVRVPAEVQLPVLDIVTFFTVCSSGLSFKNTNFTHEDFLLRPKHLPKVLPFNTIKTGGLNFKI